MLFVTYTDQNPVWLYLWMLSEYHLYLWHPSTGLTEGNGQKDQCFDAHVFMCDAPAAFSYVFFFINRAWRSQVFQDFPSLSFCAGLNQLVTSPSSNGNYVECSVGRLAFAAGHMKANGWRSTELLASSVSSWQSLSSMRTRFGSQTSFSNVDSYTHKAFSWYLEWNRYCCLCLSTTVKMQTFGWHFKWPGKEVVTTQIFSIMSLFQIIYNFITRKFFLIYIF